eukprot:473366-Prymnesium_polylepis.1
MRLCAWACEGARACVCRARVGGGSSRARWRAHQPELGHKVVVRRVRVAGGERDLVELGELRLARLEEDVDAHRVDHRRLGEALCDVERVGEVALANDPIRARLADRLPRDLRRGRPRGEGGHGVGRCGSVW